MDQLAFYARPGPMTRLGDSGGALAGLPAEPPALAAVVQGLVLHPFWAAAYGVEVPERRQAEVQIRPAAAMVARIAELDPRPLAEPRPPGSRLLGNCRHFSTLTVALLRAAGVPSRARCGFAGYFEPGRWVDHWVVEHWDGGRWVVLDAQLDATQLAATGLTDDPSDLPPGRFLRAGEAWQRCRRGEEDGERFGIFDMWGRWFIEGNVARDLAALNKVEMLPWDGWGSLAGPADGVERSGLVDDVAALTLSGDLRAVRARYQGDDGLRVPSRVLSYADPAGPTEVDVPELAGEPGDQSGSTLT